MNFISKKLLFVSLSSLLLTTSGYAEHTLRQRAGSYEDDQGTMRKRYLFDSSLKFDHSNSAISTTTYNLQYGLDQLTQDDVEDNDYAQEFDSDGSRHNQSYGLTMGQTWGKLTDTRLIGSYSSDNITTARTAGFGLSRWVWKENLQLSADLSRTIVDAPRFEILDVDSDIIAEPTNVSSTGTSISAKMLASPKTVTKLTWAHIEKDNRPPSNVYSGNVKQFIALTESAVALDVARAFNYGRITTDTTYGEVNAWIVELSFLQTLWTRANARTAYRYYREDETSRVEKERSVRGTDLVSLHFAQSFTKKDIDSLSNPVVIEASAARYLVNEDSDGRKLAANIFEVGLQTKF